MERQDIIDIASSYVLNTKDNRITQDGISTTSFGQRIFEPPIFSFGSADDPLFIALKDPNAVGDHYLLPTDWLPGARTVISFFLPFTEVVRNSNKHASNWPSMEWLVARIEGQAFINNLCRHLQEEIEKIGYKTVVPGLDARFWGRINAQLAKSMAKDGQSIERQFTSNWSERHTGFICGLGTFGLSKGLITEKGIAGRLGSLVTELPIPADTRVYDDVYEYCNMCGTCAKQCPVKTISLEEGKKHYICAAFLDKIAVKYNPRYACGKCQVSVPCEFERPQPTDDVL